MKDSQGTEIQKIIKETATHVFYEVPGGYPGRATKFLLSAARSQANGRQAFKSSRSMCDITDRAALAAPVETIPMHGEPDVRRYSFIETYYERNCNV